jgi:DNA mismatch endonuclease, patch repair protein
MDIVSKNRRSKMMAGIRGKDTRPELLVRKLLFAQGYRYRLHRKDLPGTPDIVMAKYNLCIFVHGCYWHRHELCRLAYTPKTRANFWSRKFNENGDRDKRNTTELLEKGWRVMVVWECATRKLPTDFLAELLISSVNASQPYQEIMSI